MESGRTHTVGLTADAALIKNGTVGGFGFGTASWSSAINAFECVPTKIIDEIRTAAFDTMLRATTGIRFQSPVRGDRDAIRHDTAQKRHAAERNP